MFLTFRPLRIHERLALCVIKPAAVHSLPGRELEGTKAFRTLSNAETAALHRHLLDRLAFELFSSFAVFVDEPRVLLAALLYSCPSWPRTDPRFDSCAQKVQLECQGSTSNAWRGRDERGEPDADHKSEPSTWAGTRCF